MRKKKDIVYYDKELDLDLASMDHLDDQDTEIGPTPDIDFSGPSLDPQDRFERTPRPRTVARSTPTPPPQPQHSGKGTLGGTTRIPVPQSKAEPERSPTSRLQPKPVPAGGAKPGPVLPPKTGSVSTRSPKPRTASGPPTVQVSADGPQTVSDPKPGANSPNPQSMAIEDLRKNERSAPEAHALEERVARLEVQMDRVIQLLENIATIYK